MDARILIQIPQSVAQDRGILYYFTGLPCKHGHMSQRQTSNRTCIECCEVQRKRRSELGIKYAKKPKTETQKKQASTKSGEYHRKHRDQVLQKMKERNKSYYEKNKDKIKARALSYQCENSKSRNAYKSEWMRQKAKSDPHFAALLSMRKMVARVFDRLKQKRRESVRTAEFLGFTTEEFKSHIEKQFKPGMTWENRSQWHIDHIIPLSSFDLSYEIERKRANALTNLRPIWKRENLLKSDNKIFLI